jgi:hypothetical protein
MSVRINLLHERKIFSYVKRLATLFTRAGSLGGRPLRAGACFEFLSLPLELLRELHELMPRGIIPR